MKIGVQLRPWLIQEPPPAFEAVLDEAVKAGYSAVEIGAHYLDWEHIDALINSLKTRGLCASGVHVGGDIFNPANQLRVRASLEKVAQCAAAVGAPYILFSGLLMENKTLAQRASELAAIVSAAEICTRHGLRLAYHNHWWEIGGDFTDLRYYQAHTDPALVSFCLDLGWVHRAGGSVDTALQVFGQRTPYYHLRDDGSDGLWKILGEGNMDYPRLLPQLTSLSPAFLVVEQDDVIGSVTEVLKTSLDYMKRGLQG